MVPKLWPGEALVATWPSARPWGSTGLSRVTGTLSLTTRRLVFDGRLGREDHYTWLRDIAAVHPINPFPQISVVLLSGEERHYCILKSRSAAAVSSAHHPHRDDAVQRILAAVVSARRSPWL